MESVKLVDCTSKTLNPKLIRMNCLALAMNDERSNDPISTAEGYYFYVMHGVLSGKAQIDHEIHCELMREWEDSEKSDEYRKERMEYIRKQRHPIDQP